MHVGDGRLEKGLSRRMHTLLGAMAALLAIGLGPVVAGASADGTVTLPGSPLNVSVGSLGECQSSYPNVGVNFFPPGGTLGDCGFFLAFPKTPAGQPKALQGTVYGFQGAAGPHVPFDGEGGMEYTAIEQEPVTGSGTTGDPYSEVTKFKVSDSETNEDYALVTVTTTYVNGEPQFTSSYDVQNITGTTVTPEAAKPAATLYFHAIEAGDLFVANDDHGTGVFLGGPPRFVGGQNPHTGTLGGFIEASPEWSNWQEGYWDGPFTVETNDESDKGIWNAVRTSASASEVFNDNIDPNLIDNGAGVSWDQDLNSGLAAGAHATFSIVNRSQVPSTLGVQPVNQTLTVGQTATISVTATDNVGTPYAGRSLVYSIGGSNPKSGSVITNAAGVATISYVGANAGLDTMQMFLDLAGTGVQASQDPDLDGQSHVASGAARTQQQLQSPEHPCQLQRHDHDHVRADPGGHGEPGSDGSDGHDRPRRGDRRQESQEVQAQPDQDQRQVPAEDDRLGQGLGPRCGRSAADADGQALGQGQQRAEEGQNGPSDRDPDLQIVARWSCHGADLPADGQGQKATSPQEALVARKRNNAASRRGAHGRPVCVSVASRDGCLQ